jgi:hypothetical protein
MTSYGEVRRMPQFREKSAKSESFGVGLMTYPVLQAADILLYHANVVPVGEDQRQHLELARDLAQRFNQRFGKTFVVPEGTYGEVGAKIMDLQEPTSRMSTTFSGDLGLVKVLDPPDVIRRKLRSAVTDSGREVVRSEDKPGVTNLIEIMAVATGEEPEAIEARYDGAGYGRFKEDVGRSRRRPVRPDSAPLRRPARRPRRVARDPRPGCREGARDRRSDLGASARPCGLRSSIGGHFPNTAPRRELPSNRSAVRPAFRRRSHRLDDRDGLLPHRRNPARCVPGDCG